jgi:hypothetical protein
MAVVIVNAVEPAAKTNQPLLLVASVSNRKASLSVNSATKIVAATVKSAATLNAVNPYLASIVKSIR